MTMPLSPEQLAQLTDEETAELAAHLTEPELEAVRGWRRAAQADANQDGVRRWNAATDLSVACRDIRRKFPADRAIVILHVARSRALPDLGRAR